MSVNFNLLAALTADEFSAPIETFAEYFYNGEDVKNAVDLTGCTRFEKHNSQTVEIYADRQVVFSCNITTIYDVTAITSVYTKDGAVFKADYSDLFDRIASTPDIVKAAQINELCRNIEKALTRAEQAFFGEDGNGILLDYTNGMYNMGLFHAYMDTLDTISNDKCVDILKKNHDRIEKCTKQEDFLYCSLKKTITASA